jgi:hypothetical protein
MKLAFSGQIFKNFHEYPLSASPHVNAKGQTDGETDMVKLVVAFCKFCKRAYELIHRMTWFS